MGHDKRLEHQANTIKFLDGWQEVAPFIQEVWEFLCPKKPITPADWIFVFGGINVYLAPKAVSLFRQTIAPRILITGGAGSLTREHYNDPEALVLQRVISSYGVDDRFIITEVEASNSGQNVTFGMAKILDAGFPMPRKVALVAAPFIMRRALATFALQFPDLEVIPAAPPGDAIEHIDRPTLDFAQRLVAELERLRMYAEKGFIAEVSIPGSVASAAQQIEETVKSNC